MVLRDCISREQRETELLLVQKGPAAAMAAEERDRMVQAVLPVSPSILRVEGADLGDVLDDRDCKGIFASLGVGIQLDELSDADTLDLDRLRYGKIVLALDASVEGKHIGEQVRTLFRRFLSPLLREGHVFSVDLPEVYSANEFRRWVMDPETRQLSPLS